MSSYIDALSFGNARNGFSSRVDVSVPSAGRRSRRVRNQRPSSPRSATHNVPSWYDPQDYREPAGSRQAMEAYAPEAHDQSDVSGFVSEFRRQQAKERASRKFDRQFGGSAASDPAAGPRAAVYRGEMGSSHKRASRMQGNPGQEASSAVRSPKVKKSGSLVYKPAFIAAAALLFCALFACVFLYPTAQTYYQSVREHDRIEAEFAAVQERNQALSHQLESLSTDEGLSAYAHDRYGWVNSSESSAVVLGLTDQTRNAADNVAANVAPGSVKAPETWYSPVLDVVFGVK